ncbi:MAG: immune inhibitor A [bacterium]|nr:immune inhibitor A [bacterium]
MSAQTSHRRRRSVAYSTSAFADGNNQLDPGDAGSFTVTIQNDGSRSLVNANAILRSLNTYVSVTDSVGAYGNVNAGATAVNAGNPFAVSARVATPGGYQASMQLVITDNNGVRDSTTFLHTVGTAAAASPTGPDNYGYFAYENTDTQPAGAAPTYEWLEIAPGLGGTGQSLGFTDGGENQDDIAVLALPFPFQFYGETFDTITICSNGWIAFGVSEQIDFRNYHMGSPLGPPNMIAAFWDDLVVDSIANGGVYVKHDAANGRYIVEWITRCLWSAHVANVPVAPQIFQVILFDPALETSPTGDGKILVQYQNYTLEQNDPFFETFDNDYATVGIQNANHASGLEISHWNMVTAGSTALSDGRAIMFTTDTSGVTNPHFALLTPNGGEFWLQDSTVTIAWSPGLVTGNVNIDMSRNGAAGPWASLAANSANDGQLTYVVTGPLSTTCRIRITSVSTPDSTDLSVADFTIGAVQISLLENFETGATGWTHFASPGWVDQWHISIESSHSPTHAYKCGDTGTGDHANHMDAMLVAPVVSNLPTEAVLEFWHQIESEVSSAAPDSAYDGGWVEISVDGGAFATLHPVEGYPKTTRYQASSTRPYNGPVPGQSCFAGTIDTWTKEQFDLSTFAGSSVQLRWRFAADSASVNEGWYVDDVAVYKISTATPTFVPTGLTVSLSGPDIVLRWNDDDNLSYRIYSSTTPNPPFLTWVADVNTNSHTITNGAVDPQKFYYVVGWNGQ